MSFGAIPVGVGLLLLSVFVIAGPWRQRSGQARMPEAPAGVPVLQTAQAAFEAERDAAYAVLADLDFDHGLGKLNEEDYETVRARLLAQAVAALRGLDASTADIESQIEALVRSRRAALQTNGRALNAERSSTAHPSDPNAPVARPLLHRCVGCGAALNPDDRFCARCGTPVDARCLQCGAAVQAEDRFCVGCGASLIAGVVVS